MTSLKYHYELTYGKHYTVGVDHISGQDWVPYLNNDIHQWLRENMKRGIDYDYQVGDTTAPHMKDMDVAIVFASEEDVIAFKLRWV